MISAPAFGEAEISDESFTTYTSCVTVDGVRTLSGIGGGCGLTKFCCLGCLQRIRSIPQWVSLFGQGFDDGIRSRSSVAVRPVRLTPKSIYSYKGVSRNHRGLATEYSADACKYVHIARF